MSKNWFECIRLFHDYLAGKKAEEQPFLSIREREKYRRCVDVYHQVQRGRVLRNCDEAKRIDYERWLKLYLNSGGKITHTYDYPWSRWEWFIVLKDTDLVPSYGSNSFGLIVPEGVSCEGERGHIGVYYMDGPRAAGSVPSFSDIHLDCCTCERPVF